MLYSSIFFYYRGFLLNWRGAYSPLSRSTILFIYVVYTRNVNSILFIKSFLLLVISLSINQLCNAPFFSFDINVLDFILSLFSVNLFQLFFLKLTVFNRNLIFCNNFPKITVLNNFGFINKILVLCCNNCVVHVYFNT